MRTLVTADPRDLSSSEYNRVTLWAPAYQAAPLALHALGMSWGNALRVLILTCLVLGSLGWFFYFRFFVRGKCALAVIMLVMLCSAFTLDTATCYQGGDLLLWTTAPFLITLNVLAMRTERFLAGLILTLIGGFCAIAVYVIKFSGIFLGLGLMVAWGLQVFLSRRNKRKLPAWISGAILGVVFLFLCGAIGGYTAVSSAGSKLDFKGGFAVLGLWPTAMTDLSMLIASVWGKLHLPRDKIDAVISFTGWLLIAGLALLAFERKTDLFSSAKDNLRNLITPAVFVALCVIATDTLMYVAVVLISSHVSIDARLARISGLLALPMVFVLTGRCLSQSRGAVRVITYCLILVLFVFPPVFGVARLASQLWQFYPSRGKIASDEQLVNQHFGFQDDAKNFVRELRARIPSQKTILYTTYATNLFFCPAQRCLLVEAVEMFSTDELRKANYPRPPAEGVALLLPLEFESNGKLIAIQSSFRDIHSWEYVPMKSVSDWTLWISHNEPNPSAQK